jgi:hypothetical protein
MQMCGKMTHERAEEFGAAWNSGNADLVTSFFANDGAYHARSDLTTSAKATLVKRISVAGCSLFSTGFPMANSKI